MGLRGSNRYREGMTSSLMITKLTSTRSWIGSVKVLVVVTLAALVLAAAPAKATTGIMYQFNTVFGSNSMAPTNSAPWVNATFQDVTGGVLLTITNVNLYGSEFVSEALFNLIP